MSLEMLIAAVAEHLYDVLYDLTTSHLAKSVFTWDDHFRKYDWGVSTLLKKLGYYFN